MLLSVGWKPIVKAVHELGSLFVVQLWQLGRAAHSSFLPPGNSIVGPSPIAINGATFGNADGTYGAAGVKVPYEVPKELTPEEIDAIVEDYVKSAKFAKEAGFDGIEI
jgi:N-ethylmaleimide reductase